LETIWKDRGNDLGYSKNVLRLDDPHRTPKERMWCSMESVQRLVRELKMIFNIINYQKNSKYE